MDTHPGTAACEAEALRKAFGSSLKTTSARQLKLDDLGDQAVGYAFTYEQPSGTPKRIYVTIIEFVEGRGIANALDHRLRHQRQHGDTAHAGPSDRQTTQLTRGRRLISAPRPVLNRVQTMGRAMLRRWARPSSSSDTTAIRARTGC